MDDPAPDTRRVERRRATRDLVVAGGISGPRELARRLAEAGIETSPDAVRADLRSLGVIRVVGPEGPLLAIPEDRAAAAPARGSADVGPGLVAEITSDPDWKLQVVVLSVVLAFLLAGLVAWLLGP